jgi:hypothetical protein
MLQPLYGQNKLRIAPSMPRYTQIELIHIPIEHIRIQIKLIHISIELVWISESLLMARFEASSMENHASLAKSVQLPAKIKPY